jgi:hypothetical protein
MCDVQGSHCNVSIKFTAFRDVTSCSLVDKYLLSSDEWKARQLIETPSYVLCKLKTSTSFSEQCFRCTQVYK